MKKLSQILSITLSSALVVTSAPWPAAAVGPVATMPAFAQAFAPAESLGYVASSYSPSGQVERPRLIVISDLHAHVEVQHHIVDILDGLVNKLTTGPAAQKQVQIFVEGGWQPHLEHPLKTVQNSRIRSVMAEYFLQKAEIPATQAFSERHPTAGNFTLTGVENKDEYDANRARFLQSYPVRKRLLEAIARHEASLKDLTNSVEARSYQKMQEMRRAYQTGSLSGDRYARALVKQAGRYSIENRYVGLLRQPNAPSAPGFDLALSEVGRLVSVKLSSARPLAAYFRGDEKTVRANIATVDAYLDILKRTLGNQLTPEEVPFAYARIPQMTQVAKILLADEALDIDIPGALQKALAFYPFAFMRNDSLVGNSLAALQKDGKTDAGILVVGGFHSEAISQYLQARQIPYILINPVVSRDLSTVEQLNYVERMAGEHVSAAEARADFSHPMGQSIAADARTGATAISDLAQPSVVPGAPAVPEADIANEVKNAVEGQNDKPKTGGFASEADAILGIIGTNLGKNAIASSARGILTQTGETSARIDYLNHVIKDFSLPVEATADAAKGASFVRENGVYKGTEDAAVAFSPLLDIALAAIPEADRLTPGAVDFQPVKGSVLLKYREKNAPSRRGETLLNKNMIVVGMGTQRPVVLFNEDMLPDLQKAGAAVAQLKAGIAVNNEGHAALNNLTAMSHELTHVFSARGQEGYVEERYVQSRALISTMKFAAQVGVEHGASVGQATTSIPTAVAVGLLRTLESQVPDNQLKPLSERINLNVTSPSNGRPISLNSVSSIINDMLNPDAARKQAKLELAALKNRLKVEFPAATPEQIEASIGQPVLAGFPFGPGEKKVEDGAKKTLKNLLAMARQA